MGVHSWVTEMHVRFWQGNVKERNSLEHPVIDEITTLTWSLEIGWDGMDWINPLALEMDI